MVSSISAMSMANLALQAPFFASCYNVLPNLTFLAFPSHLSVFPRTSPKSSINLVSQIVPTLSRQIQKQCIVRALSPDELVLSKSAVEDVQEASRKGRKKGNAVLSSKKAVPATKKTSRKKKTEVTTSAEDYGSTVGVKNRRKKTPKNKHNSLDLEKDDAVDDGDIEYDWPPLVCCFGLAQNEFVPTVRISERQMHEDMYSTWKGLQWSPPEFARAPGGPASNVAIALVRLGGRAAFMGKVGDDPFGYKMLQTMNEENVQTRGVKFDPYASTAVSYLNIIHQDGKLRMERVKSCAEDRFQSSEINVDILKEAKMLHLNSMILIEQPMTALSVIKMSKEFGGIIFFDPNLPLPLWRSRDDTRTIIQDAWNEANMIEVTIHELEFLLDEKYYENMRTNVNPYYINSVKDLPRRRKCYHYTREEIAPLWHDNIKILFVTDGTWRIHYYTPTFEGEVIGTEDVLVAPETCDRTGSGDAIVAAIIRKLTAEPELLNNQDQLERQLRFVICAGIIAQWTTGSIPGLPTESAAQNLKEQVYVTSLW